MKKIFCLVYLLLCLFFITCNKKKTSSIDKIDKICLTSKEIKEIVSQILYSKNVEQYLRFNIEKKKSIKLLKNKYLNDSLDIYFENKKVAYSKTLEDYRYIVDLSFFNIICNNSLEFSFYYKFQGAHVEGVLKKENNQWKLDQITLDGEEQKK